MVGDRGMRYTGRPDAVLDFWGFGPMRMQPGVLFVVGTTLFTGSLMTGTLVTSIPPYSVEMWWLWSGIRVTAVGVSTAVLLFSAGGGGRLGLLLALFAAVCSYAPALDLVRGPVTVHGEIRYATSTSGPLVGTGRVPVRRGSGRAHGRLELQDDHGTNWVFTPWGAQANALERYMRACDSSAARVQALRYLDIVLSVDCGAPGSDVDGAGSGREGHTGP